MKLQYLKLLNFRNYEQLDIAFHPNLNIFFGKNGSGKTNLIEAIYVLALTKSFRVNNDKVLIKNDSLVSRVDGEIKYMENKVDNYRILFTKEGKKVKINKNKINRLSDYILNIPIVLFHPDDLRILKDTPGTRRKQLNISISQIDREYMNNLAIYNKLLKQRNAYLKKVKNDLSNRDYLDVLTSKLVDYGIKICYSRETFFNKLNGYVKVIYKNITGLENLNVVYKSDYLNISKDEILKMYEKGLKKDLYLGKTNYGVHTDDFKFILDTLDLKEYGSEGQQKNAVISFKLAELEYLYNINGFYPILILDDLLSELDKEKIHNIFKILNSDVQTFITTTEFNFFDDLPFNSCKSYEIKEGKIVKESKHEK